ncbi:hypothetical protein F0562_025762 [Nyssa sinensis]|uniref:Uncharacterized protein n=1 Tax=Nyssa sinensis TaxID=561372 RepID=A0A5J5B9E6_9ASTE|nr:hypothetical protein F0562_025762 [Nyssa sinensis]
MSCYGGSVSFCHFLGSSSEESSLVSICYCSNSSPCHLGFPIDEPLVREFYANLETVHDQVTTRAFVRGINFDLTRTLIAKTLGIPREDQPSFPYAPALSLGMSCVITTICVSQYVPIYTSDMVRELSGPYTRCTLTQSQRHVGPVDADAITDMEAIHEHQDQFVASLSAMATNLHSLIPDDDGDDGDDGDFPLDSSTA